MHTWLNIGAFLKYLQKPKLYQNFKGFASLFPLPASLKKFLSGIDQDPRKTFLNFSSLKNIPEEEFSKFLVWYPDDASSFQNALHFDRTYYLINDVLKIHDNACMAHGIEGRAPYLYSELLEFALSQTEFSTQSSLQHLCHLSSQNCLQLLWLTHQCTM